ncbi:MAG: transketolase [Oscillospiraceae bacterium]|nr:transketolase [Oscillospiraceae bacterium]
MDPAKKQQLAVHAANIRVGIIDAVYAARSGHPGGSLSIADLLAYLYFHEMKVDPANPGDPGRDRLVLSKGHAAPGIYSALAERGYFPKEELLKLRHTGGMLQGHPDMKGTPGVDMSTGSLGQGVSAAVGMALAGKIDANKNSVAGSDSCRVFAILGDGELQEGQVWEAAMFAAAKKLDNLCVIVDNNGLQIDGPIDKVNSPYPIPEKWAAFGFNTIVIDAHDFDQYEAAFDAAKACKDKPTAIIQLSTKGKGVSFMENQASWHGAAPNKEQYEQAMAELSAALRELEG